MMAKDTLFGEGIQNLRDRILRGINPTGREGTITRQDVVTPYLNKILSDVKLARPVKVAIDCGNGVTGQPIGL